MKKKFLFIFILLCTISLVGCGSGGKKVKGDGYIVSYEDAAVFDKYDKKSIDKVEDAIFENGSYLNLDDADLKEFAKHLSYKEIKWVDFDNLKQRSLLIYNDDKYAYNIESVFYYTLPDTKEGNYYRSPSNIFWSKLLPDDALLLTTQYEDNMVKTEYDLSINRHDGEYTKTKDDYLGNKDYSYLKYVKDEENNRLNIYFKYNSNGKNITTVHLYCVKDNELKNYYNTTLDAIDENEEATPYADVTKKGETAVAEFEFHQDQNWKNCDSFVYFVEGFYDDDDE